MAEFGDVEQLKLADVFLYLTILPMSERVFWDLANH